jgi:hypothetical protein
MSSEIEQALKKKPNVFQSLAFLAIVGGAAYYFLGGGIQEGVANDLVKQYDIAAKGGDKMSICIQAQLVAAGYLQAENQEKYLEWKKIQNSDCAAAGLPMP